MIPYSEDIIATLNKNLEGRSKDEDLLTRFPELFMMVKLLKTREKPIADILIEKGFVPLVAFAYAVFGDEKASQRLVEKGETVWAAVANAARNDYKAAEWLTENKLNEYLKLSKNVEPFTYEPYRPGAFFGL